MDSDNVTYIQCQCCGNISLLNEVYDINELYINNYRCDCCGHKIGLNIGNKKEDIYMYLNSNFDNRFFNK